MNNLHLIADWFDDNNLHPDITLSMSFPHTFDENCDLVGCVEVVIPRWQLTIGEFSSLLRGAPYRQCAPRNRRMDIWTLYHTEVGVFTVRIMEALNRIDPELLSHIELIEEILELPTEEVSDVVE